MAMHGISETLAVEEVPELVSEDPFTALVRRNTRFVFRIAYSVLRNVHDCDDVVQETFLKLYRSSAWRLMKDERAFLARAAWRLAVSRLPKRSAETLHAATPFPGPDPEQAALVTDWNAAIRRLIDTLPEQLRQPLALSGVEEMTSREIADVMGIPEGTVRTRLMRGRQILKEKLKALGVASK